MGFPLERKEAVLKKMLPPHNKSIPELAKEEGISAGTLYNWRKAARAEGRLMPDGDTTPQGWVSSDKFAAVMETGAMNEAELSAYCRQRGLYPEQIREWKEACEKANDWDQTQTKRLKEARKSDENRIRELERELRRKEKALAETAALLVLGKKAQANLGGCRGRMISTPDRRKIVKLIDEARQDGASREKACKVLGISLRTYQRWTLKGDIESDGRPCATHPPPINKLTPKEREQIVDTSNQPEYKSLPPSQIVPALADKGIYIASESSFYRVLKEAEQRHHRGKAQAPRKSTKPKSYKATGPNQVWSWDITYLAAAITGTFYRLYLVMDIYSRKIVGWEIHETETAAHASMLIRKACLAEGINDKKLVLHSDNGAPMKGATMLATLQKLGVVPSFSRPSVSDDNPYSESLFKTLKYTPAYPSKAFESLDMAREWVLVFVRWYNDEHHHSGIQFVTPAERHRGQDREILLGREAVYTAANECHPERWSRGTRNWAPIEEVWLNPENTSASEGGIIEEAA
ncbi:MAG: IS3 family transposase [Candidatus Polarisedimenticolaceae bacterium]|nr:IS3 family transposase [Candidatus Polarisedimenticolaceae bacterium]